MSTTDTPISGTSETSPSSGTWKKITIGVLGALLLAFLALEATSLLAAQRTEQQRRQVGKIGGKCEFEHRVPTWLQTIAGKDSPAFMGYPVIVGVSLTGPKVGDANVANLPVIPELRMLDLHDSRVTSQGIASVVKQWNNIQKLDLGNTPITDITPLSQLPHLETLQLNFSQVRREYLTGLADLKNLKELGAGYIQVTDRDVLEIAKCPLLEELSIAASALGEGGLQPLTHLKHLKTLVLKDAKFNAEDLQAFQSARPDVTLVL